MTFRNAYVWSNKTNKRLQEDAIILSLVLRLSAAWLGCMFHAGRYLMVGFCPTMTIHKNLQEMICWGFVWTDEALTSLIGRIPLWAYCRFTVLCFLPGSYSCLRTELILRREYSYYLIQLYIPSFMLVVVSWVNFWIDKDSVPARVRYGLFLSAIPWPYNTFSPLASE